MSKPTIQEMREQLVNNEVDYIKELVFKDRHQELFDYIYTNSFRDFKNIDDNDVIEMYRNLYGDMFDEEEVSDE
tara:strand:+ start:902 stop:1123 length:222 start_codon:yes stop_codon:yes gene_type:complete